ncbi:MAG TPA: hypothetical protein VIG33_17065 [Pseudobdellovibrionaceae bacterium]|jgi:hypothetical protein
MKLNKSHLIVFLLAGSLVACVTEVKEPQDNKPYVATLAPEKGESAAGTIVIKCRSKYDKDAKPTVCGASTVKLTNEITKSVSEHSFKGEKANLAVAGGGSFSVEVKTKGCETKRVFSGMTGGMILVVQFDNCAVK